MSRFGQRDYPADMARGLTEYTKVNKFGHNHAIGRTMAPITLGGVWETPQVAGATTLRVKAGDANDTAAGSGARAIRIEGVNTLGENVVETLITAGTSASAASTTSYIRIYRASVSASGTYATASASSHAADIVIESVAGVPWAHITPVNLPLGQSEIGVYTIPTGKAAIVPRFSVHVDSSKTATIMFLQRSGVLDTAPPYSAMKAVANLVGVTRSASLEPAAPFGPFPAGTDIGFMAKVASGTAAVSVDFDIWLYDA